MAIQVRCSTCNILLVPVFLHSGSAVLQLEFSVCVPERARCCCKITSAPQEFGKGMCIVHDGVCLSDEATDL